MNRDCEMDEDEFVEIGKELRSHPYQSERDKVLDELGKILNTRIAKMEILDSKNPSPFRKGILEAYRDIERWEIEMKLWQKEEK